MCGWAPMCLVSRLSRSGLLKIRQSINSSKYHRHSCCNARSTSLRAALLCEPPVSPSTSYQLGKAKSHCDSTLPTDSRLLARLTAHSCARSPNVGKWGLRETCSTTWRLRNTQCRRSMSAALAVAAELVAAAAGAGSCLLPWDAVAQAAAVAQALAPAQAVAQALAQALELALAQALGQALAPAQALAQSLAQALALALAQALAKALAPAQAVAQPLKAATDEAASKACLLANRLEAQTAAAPQVPC